MELERIARILYNMSLDMDGVDYEEESEEEIKGITQELQALHDAEMPYLLKLIESIALDNENME